MIALILVLALLCSACQPVATPAMATMAVTATISPSNTPVSTATLLPSTSTVTPLPTASPTVSPTPRPLIRRVLILSMDGLRADMVEQADMPNLMALMQAGAFTLNAQTTFPSATLPAHTSMVTGLCPAKHGVDWNDYLPEKGYAKGTDLFDLAHAAGLKTIMFVGKEKLRQITEPSSLDVFRYYNDRDLVIVDRIAEEFPLDFGLMFVHFPTPDAMGHAYGWMSPQYISVVQRADEALGNLLRLLDERGLRQETLIIVTADHGGHAQTHGSRLAEDMTIPWVISGPGIRPGPLTTPIQTIDTAATVAWALNLPRPVEWDGWPVFEAFGQIPLARPSPFCE